MARKLFKRGMSPIVATILLIALAVSIGATIMSLGGAYYEKLVGEDSSCSEILINAYELEGGEQCKNYAFESFVNFYSINETVILPQCYKGIATGKGNICAASEKLLKFSWVPTKNIIE